LREELASVLPVVNSSTEPIGEGPHREFHMNLEKTLATALVAAAIGLSPLAADAQDRGNGGRQRGGGRATASAPAQRSESGRQAAVRQAPRQAAPQGGQAASRASGSRQYSAPAPPSSSRSYGGPTAVPRSSENRPHASQPAPRASASAQAAPRQYGAQPAPRQAVPRQAVPRQSYSYGGPGYANRAYNNGRYGHVPPPRYYYARPYYGHGYVRPYGWAPYRPYYFSRAYYSFSPWFSIGFGISIGYPVSYPYAYLGTYRPRVYGYYDGSYTVTAGVPVYGGVSFDIQPSDADVWVDGDYVGTVGTFTPYGEPLTLTPGQHRIVVQREGFRAMEWEVTIEPGQVVPYRGAMQRY
jgi:hypothetical protein